jgi:hypothetical protein
MKAVNKQALIDNLEQQVDAHLQQAIKVYQNLDADVLSKPAATGGWSIAQCLEHLNSYGNYYLPHIEKTLRNNHSESSTFTSGWLGDYFTKSMDPTAGKKMKALKGHMPAVQLDAYAVVAEFIQQQEKLLVYLRQARKADLDIRIPITITKLIRLKLGDVFQFLIMHDERHIQQANRNL